MIYPPRFKTLMDYSDRWSELLPQILDAVMDTYDPRRDTLFKILFTDKMGQITGSIHSIKTPLLPAAKRTFRDSVQKELVEKLRNRDPG